MDATTHSADGQKNLVLENNQQIFRPNLAANLDHHFGDYPVALGIDGSFHFHRFDGQHGIALQHFFTGLGDDTGDNARHRRTDMVGIGGFRDAVGGPSEFFQVPELAV